jgi:catechol 2,3-dioxygenase-like lactoylglutathione lyase family enzyme
VNRQRDVKARLDHVVFGVPDLESSIESFGRTLGATPAFGGRHQSIGTHNAILPLDGGRYVELIARDPSCPTPPQGVPWDLDTLREPRLITWAVATQNMDLAVERAKNAGYDPGSAIELRRDTPTGDRLTWRLTVSREFTANGLVPFLIDWGTSPHPSTVSRALCSIKGFRAEHPDPESVKAPLNALGVSLEVEPGMDARLRGTLVGPDGSIVLG